MQEQKTSLRAIHVGCGSIAQGAWLPALKENPRYEVVGVVDPSTEATARALETLGRGNAYPSLAEAFDAHDDIQAVLISTPPAFRKELIELAFAKGCDVLCEKPLSDDLSVARDLVRIAEAEGRKFGVIQNRRVLPGMREVSETIAANRIGTVGAISCDFFKGPRFGGFREEMEHVLLLDMAIHTFDQARYMIGDRAISAFCHEYNPPHSWFRHGASASASFEMASGAVFHYRGSWCSAFAETSWQASWRIDGALGTLLFDGETSLSLHTESGQEVIPVTDLPKNQTGHAGLLENFADAVLDGAPLVTTGADHLESLRMVFAAVASAESGQRELLP